MLRTTINPDIASMPETSDGVVSQLSLDLGKALIKFQLDEMLHRSDRDMANRLLAELSESSKSVEAAQIINDPSFVTVLMMLLEELDKQYTYIHALFEYEGMLRGFYYSATIPSANGENHEFKRNQAKQAIQALDQLRERTHSAWENTPVFIQALIAPIIFRNIFYFPTAVAMDFYLTHFDEAMLKTAKELVKQSPYSIYKGETSISVDVIFTRFADDKSFIGGLLPPNDPYMVYSVFSSCNLEYAQICWSAASDDQKKALLNVACRRLGDIFPPALVSAYVRGNEDMMDWLWSLANTLELKKQLLQTVIAESRRNPVTLLFSSLDARDKRYFETAVKIAMRDGQHFVDLVEHNRYELLTIAANLGSHDLVKKYLDIRHEPLDRELYNRLFMTLNEKSLIKQLQRLEPPKRLFGL